MSISRHCAFLTSAILLIATVWTMAAYPRGLSLQFPESRAAVEELLRQTGTKAFASGVGFDQYFIVIYATQLIAWVFWIVFGAGEKERSAMAAAAGAILMILAAGFWDYRENARLLDLFHSFDTGRVSAFELLPLRTACSRKWGYLGMSLLLAAIANGFGMWTRRHSGGVSPRRIRTWACVAGGLAGIAGGSALIQGLSTPSRWALFQAAATGLGIAAATVLWETRPGLRRNQ